MLRNVHAHHPHGFHGQAQFNLTKLLEQMLNPVQAAGGCAPVSAWGPRVDLKQTSEAFFITADLPGVDSAAITLQVDKGVLTLEGTRAEAELAEGETLVRQERHTGAFKRSFNLPDNADVDSITASTKNGVLEVRIAKQPQAQPRRIDITA